MTKNQILELQLLRIAELTGDYTTSELAKLHGKSTYLSFDNAPHYGGYRLNRVRIENGGHTKPFNGLSDTEPRLKFSEFMTLLNGIEIGLSIEK